MSYLTKTEKTYFYFGLFLKILLGSFLASHFLTELFIPFINYFVESGFSDPYSFFDEKNSADSFPYPALMLYIMSLTTFLFGSMAEGSSYIQLFLIRIPLLVADIGIFFILRSWLRNKSYIKLIWLYWLSPVLLYISYVHGQLDVIPIALLFLSLNFLFKKKLVQSGVFFGLALATKTMVFLALPFIFLFLISKATELKYFFYYIIALILAFLLPNLPFLFDPSFQQMVFNNSEQSKVFELYFSIGNATFYLIPASLLLLIIRGALIKNYNQDIFIMFLGFAFGIILIFVSPMQGWYFWLVPFLTYFYAKSDNNSYFLLFILQVFYFLYFALITDSDYFEVFQPSLANFAEYNNPNIFLSSYGFDANLYLSITFTMLQVILGVNCFWIYRAGITSYTKHKITSTPFLLGIGGDSGTGKTTISNALKAVFTSSKSMSLEGDDMHKWQRGDKKWKEFTHLDPKANLLHQEVGMLSNLKAGKKISRKSYDHAKGTFGEENLINPSNLIIFEGLHPFYITRQRLLFDLKLFMAPERNLSNHWKIRRDIKERGYSKEKILETLSEREEDSKKFIESQEQYADIIITPTTEGRLKNVGDENENPETIYKLSMLNSIFLEPILDQITAIEGIDIEHTFVEDNRQAISLSGEVATDTISSIAKFSIPGLEEIGVDSAQWPQGSFGILILLIVYYIFEEADYGKA